MEEVSERGVWGDEIYDWQNHLFVDFVEFKSYLSERFQFNISLYKIYAKQNLNYAQELRFQHQI